MPRKKRRAVFCAACLFLQGKAMEVDQTRASLLQAIKAGDNVSWEVFYRRYSPLAKMVGRGCHLDASELDEFVQDVMTDFFNAQQKFTYDPSKGRFRDYFLRIVRNRLYARFRAQKRHDAHFSALDEEASAEIPDQSKSELESVWDQEWQSHVLNEAMQAIKQSPAVSPRDLQIFDLWEMQSVSPKEIAKMMKVSLATVYNARNRVIETLRDIVKSLDEGVEYR